jgi:hypothetical protein
LPRHLLFADNDIVEQALELRRHSRIDQCRIGLFENAEQRQAGLGRHDVLSLGNQERPTTRSDPQMLRPGIEALWTRRTIADEATFLIWSLALSISPALAASAHRQGSITETTRN